MNLDILKKLINSVKEHGVTISIPVSDIWQWYKDKHKIHISQRIKRKNCNQNRQEEKDE